MQRGKNFKNIDAIANEQFIKLTKQEQYLYDILRESKIIKELIKNGVSNKYRSILNFKASKESDRTYFSLDIIETSVIQNNYEVLFKIEGSIIDNFQENNIVYVVTNLKNNHLRNLYVDSYINVNNNAILNEITYINVARQISRTEHVCLTIKKFPVEQNEIFIIDPDSDIYKLYSSRQIDATTLCNLILLQAHKQEEKTSSFVKKMDKKFI